MSRSFRLIVAIAVILSFVVCQATLTLAGTTGTINGKVTDQLGHPIANVRISVVAPSIQLKTTTGSNGFYSATGLPPDTYTVTFDLAGYLTDTARGITLSQDQVYVLNVELSREVKTIGRIPVRGSTSLVQPTKTVNQYTVTPQGIQTITGTPQNISENEILNSLPGVTTESGGRAIIPGPLAHAVAFKFEGIEPTEPVAGQFINSLPANGVAPIQL